MVSEIQSNNNIQNNYSNFSNFKNNKNSNVNFGMKNLIKFEIVEKSDKFWDKFCKADEVLRFDKKRKAFLPETPFDKWLEDARTFISEQVSALTGGKKFKGNDLDVRVLTEDSIEVSELPIGHAKGELGALGRADFHKVYANTPVIEITAQKPFSEQVKICGSIYDGIEMTKI